MYAPDEVGTGGRQVHGTILRSCARNVNARWLAAEGKCQMDEERQSCYLIGHSMHIGFFTDGFTPQLHGVATNLEALTDALEGRGDQVSLFAPRMGDYVDRRPGVYRLASVRAVRQPPLWLSIPVSRRVLRHVPRLGLDVVHTHSPFTAQWLALQATWRARVPLVSTYHTLLPAYVKTVKLLGRFVVPPGLAEAYSAWTCNACDHVIAPSAKTKALLEQFGVRRPISVIANGIELARFQGGARGYLRDRWGLRPTDRILLSVGRLTPEKNVGFLLAMLARLSPRAANVYLVLVGEGFLRKSLECDAQRLGIRRQVIFCGAVPHAEMSQVYADADVYLTASLSETFGLATLEALASGLPIVGVRDASLDGMLVDGANGFAVEPDAGAIAARLEQVLGDPSLLAQMRARSGEIALNFSVQAQAQQLLNLYGC
ncbi:MAG: glycosyltransferase family 4 protein, partial [Chloroflexi bacterium]